ncbi:hypothetical protein BGZ73_006814 [Actinomortierella ambigua]|nr:hypothetical protein BGZ73_006814 [Actinomortierella ambigua]
MTVHQFEIELDALGQQPLQNIYTPLTLAYAVDDEASYATIVDTLKAGLLNLTKGFPWVAGQVICEGATAENSGVYKIVPNETHPPLIVKDLRDDSNMSTFASLKETKFPCSAPVMDENVLSARHSMSNYFDHVSPKPVFLVQATFIKGGLLLTFTTHHLVFDITGHGHIMALLSKACHNEAFNRKELASGKLDGPTFIPSLENMNPADDPSYQFQIAKPPSADDPFDQLALESKPATLNDLPKATWANFSFDTTALAALKVEANNTRLPSVPYVSTDDALTALILRSSVRARLHRCDPASKVSNCRAVNMRRRLGVPENYLGVMINMAYIQTTYEQIATEELGAVASRLRGALDGPRLVELTRGFVTMLRNAPNKWGLSITSGLDLANNLLTSSWTKVQSYELDYNLGLGKPVAVRRPTWTPATENLAYFMPTAPNGDIVVAFCLRDEDMVNLRADAEFNKYATYIG